MTSARKNKPAPPQSELTLCFTDKAQARAAVWTSLVARKVARFPFPVRGRIPNFDGADAAAAQLMLHPAFVGAKCVKVNPDAPQRHVRKALLDRGIRVLTPTPRLKGGFFLLDPDEIPKQHYWDAASIKMGGVFGMPIPLDSLPCIDLIVMGSVAVTRDGKRLGKGHGYADLEYAILRELDQPPIPVFTTVHSLQVLQSFPTSAHDVPVSAIATPEELIEVLDIPPPPDGIDWNLLSDAALADIPLLNELRSLKHKS
ncbi:MAG: 5-formyltetrahydrofolate cyclo-ligase [Betaproteobacteria bacterium]